MKTLPNRPIRSSGRRAPIRVPLLVAVIAALSAGCPGGVRSTAVAGEPSAAPSPADYDSQGMVVKIERTEAKWRSLLTLDQFRIARERGTEPPFENAYWDEKRPGLYSCVACGLLLFRSDDKIDSCSGWPSFSRPADPRHVLENSDLSHGMSRNEVSCARCDSHLGHVFDDGPPPDGLRY